MCIEAAVNYACGLPHGDNPSCVGNAVRSFKIRLNDARWSSNQARAEGMKKIAIAQLGSNTINQREFANIVAFKTITVLMPIFLEDRGYKEEAILCKNSANLQEARSSMLKVRDALRKIAYAAYAAADKYLIISSNICLEALTELKSPGVQFLYLYN